MQSVLQIMYHAEQFNSKFMRCSIEHR